MIVMGKEFPDTADGYNAAADHVFTLGPTFYQDAISLRDEARRLHRSEFMRNVVLAVVAVIVLLALRNW